MAVSITSQNPLTYTVVEGGNGKYALDAVGTIEFTYDDTPGVSFTKKVTDTASNSSAQNPYQGLFAANIETYANGTGTIGFHLVVPESSLFQDPNGITITFDLQLIESTISHFNIASTDAIITAEIQPFGNTGVIKLSASETVIIDHPVAPDTTVDFPPLGTAILDILFPDTFQGTVDGLQPGDEINFAGKDITEAVPLSGGIEYLYRNGEVKFVPTDNFNSSWAIGVSRDLNGGTKTVVLQPGALTATVTNTGLTGQLSADQLAAFDQGLLNAFNQYAQHVAGKGNISIALNFINDPSKKFYAEFTGPAVFATDSNGAPINDPDTNQQLAETAPQYIIAHNGARPSVLPAGTPDVMIDVNLAGLSGIDLDLLPSSVPQNQMTVTNMFLHELAHAFGMVVSDNPNQQTIFSTYLNTDSNRTFFVDPLGSISPTPVILNPSDGGVHLATGNLDVFNAGSDQLLGQPDQRLSATDLTILRLVDPPVYGEIDIAPGTTFELTRQEFSGEDIGFVYSPGTSAALKLDIPLTGVIKDFSVGDTIDLTYVTTVNFGSGAQKVHAVWDEGAAGTSGTLSIIDPSLGSSPVAVLSLLGNYLTSQFVVSDDGESHPLISLTGWEVSYAGGADFVFKGLGPHNSVVFGGTSGEYHITNNGSGNFTVVDTISGRDGSDQVSGAEFLKFKDQTVFIEDTNSANIARLYSAALGRSPDVGGLSGWEDIYATKIPAAVKAQGIYVALAQADLGGGTSIAGGFTHSTEFLNKYGALDDAGFITLLYNNVLDRAPDAAGLAGWLNAIHQDGLSREWVLVGFAESQENINKTAADWLIQV